jgi:hypothetical protein
MGVCAFLEGTVFLFLTLPYHLYFPRLTTQSCRQGEQPLGDGLNFLLGDTWA